MTDRVRDHDKAHVWQHRTYLDWIVYYRGEIQWFPKFRDAYDYAYNVTRVRKSASDAISNERLFELLRGAVG